MGIKMDNMEIKQLICSLEGERKRRYEAESNLVKFVEFITFVHGEIARVMTSLVSMSSKNLSSNPYTVSLGSFQDEEDMDNFLEVLKTLASQFREDYESLEQSQDVPEKIDLILKAVSTIIPESEEALEKKSGDDDSGGSDLTLLISSPTPQLPSSSNGDVVLDPLVSDLIGIVPSTSQSHFFPSTIQNYPRNRRTARVHAENSRNFVSVNKRHGVDHSKHHRGLFCLCGTKWSNKNSLRRHVKYFTMEWKISCDYCNKRFPFLSFLKRHLYRGHKVTEPKCSEICSRAAGIEFELTQFSDIQIIGNAGASDNTRLNQSSSDEGAIDPARQHGIDYQSIIPNRCICGKSYKSKPALYMHVTSKINGRVFQCYICNRTFYPHQNLKEHVRDVHRVTYRRGRFGCSICGSTFGSLGLLRNHRLQKHCNQTKSGRNIIQAFATAHQRFNENHTIGNHNTDVINDQSIETNNRSISPHSAVLPQKTLVSEPPEVNIICDENDDDIICVD